MRQGLDSPEGSDGCPVVSLSVCLCLFLLLVRSLVPDGRITGSVYFPIRWSMQIGVASSVVRAVRTVQGLGDRLFFGS